MSDEKENNQHNDNKSVSGLSGDPTIMIEWSPENEEIMVEWCDVAQCYKWLNLRAHGKYSRLHAWFTIPAIILSDTRVATFCPSVLYIFNVTNSVLGIENSMVVFGLKGLG